MSNTVFFICLAIAAVTAVFGIVKLSSSSKWHETEGTINRAEVEVIHRYNSSNNSTSANDHKIIIEYSYTINGENYSGDRLLAYGPNVVDNRHTADSFINDFPVGKTTTVFYEPGNPTNSALIAGKSISNSAIVIMSVMVFIVVGILGVVGFYFNRIFS